MIPGAPSTPPAPKDPAAQAHASRVAAHGTLRTVATIVQALPLEHLQAERDRLDGHREPPRIVERKRLDALLAFRLELDAIDREARA